MVEPVFQVMALKKPQQLSPSYSAESDTLDEQAWYQILGQFEDGNIYQTWAYATTIAGQRNVSHVVLRKDGQIVSVALARIAKLPFMKVGIAYVMWGPLWRLRGVEADIDVLRQAVRALRNEYVCKRGLVLRLFPLGFDEDSSEPVAQILQQEGFAMASRGARSRTLLMDLTQSVEALRSGIQPHWNRELKVAEKKNLQIVQSGDDHLFRQFVTIYNEMVSRKRFVEPNDIHQFGKIQRQLPEQFKMKILLCKSGGEICAGAVCSAIGNSAVYLFGATSNNGLKSRGSYLLQWELIKQLKQGGSTVYNLNGINPATNPGTYRFKNDLAGKNGRDVYFLGRFESHASVIGRLCVDSGELVRAVYRKCKTFSRPADLPRVWPKSVN